MIRLTSRFWVDAYLARLRVYDIHAFIVAHGDDTGGTILVKMSTLDCKATLYQRAFDLMSGEQKWAELAGGSEVEVDASVARQCSFDPDVWVVEVEDPQGRHLLDQDGLT